ncbi:PREDICTED: general transcription factor 3C polypeptide 4 [Nanorana parkeri]|uniref:general transcription factor 3C polypeptide 4 n=1 Tax=Nanorana parkeri TaxID=125878 RepID=UPI00085480A5|nr:PREDICTED: general transcription factor 3C polypeptide 4 [Nanorana parkeri]
MSEPERGPGCSEDPRPSFRLSVGKREPVVKLLQAVTGLDPLSWSEDHRLSVCTSSNVSVLEQLCDIHGNSPELTLHRTCVSAPHKTCFLRIGSPKEVEQCRAKFARSNDPTISQKFMLDRVFNPEGKGLPPLQGYKYACWTPAGCDANGRCLLAALTLDNRLTINANVDRLQWKQLADLTEMYGERLAQSNYTVTEDAVHSELEDFPEYQRRHSMQTPVRMEWSSICTTQEIMENNTCRDVGTVLLAVLFENGDVAIWQFQLPIKDRTSIISCNTIMSGVESPSALAWWEYEHSNRKMSGLIVGSSLGPVKIIPVNLKAVKGYFTLRQPVILWQEVDHLPVNSIKCIALYHPYQKCSCSLVVAARGCYVFWCLLLISKAGLNVHNSHVTGLHSLPIISLSVDKQNGTIYSCSVDGKVQQLIPLFTSFALKFEHQLINLSEMFGSVKSHGIATSPFGAYLACITSEGLNNGIHPVNKNFQVNFVVLKTFEEAAAQLLESSSQNLFRQMDLTDLVRWKILKDKVIPQFLMDALDKKVDGGPLYFWRFRLFLLKIWYQSFKKITYEAMRKQSFQESKVSRTEDAPVEGSIFEEEKDLDEDKHGDSSGSTSRDTAEPDVESSPADESLLEIQQKIEALEAHLTKENMKHVLGEVYLHTGITEYTSVPTRGICAYLMANKDGEDRTVQVLIGHIEKKMNKQMFPEYCTLCKQVLPFADSKKAVCPKGHLWSRCSLTYQACQTLDYRRCLLRDSIARHSVPEDLDWIKRLLGGPCTLCDSPVF